jgi:hypothetical protein
VVCAVCATEYDDDPEAKRIRRCPACHSRLIRQPEGGLASLDTPAAPPKSAPPARWRMPDARTPVMALSGVLLIALGLSALVSQFDALMSTFTGVGTPTQHWAAALGIAAACLLGGLWLIWHAIPQSEAPVPGRPCYGCGYVLPARHRGRCPECGKLQNPDDPRNGICPGCRRSLRGFFGDACPECGSDVHEVVDGQPPDRPLL